MIYRIFTRPRVRFLTKPGAAAAHEEFDQVTFGFDPCHTHFGGWAESVDADDFDNAVGCISRLMSGEYPVAVWSRAGSYAGTFSFLQGAAGPVIDSERIAPLLPVTRPDAVPAPLVQSLKIRLQRHEPKAADPALKVTGLKKAPEFSSLSSWPLAPIDVAETPKSHRTGNTLNQETFGPSSGDRIVIALLRPLLTSARPR